jgi:hypothetical protein
MSCFEELVLNFLVKFIQKILKEILLKFFYHKLLKGKLATSTLELS